MKHRKFFTYISIYFTIILLNSCGSDKIIFYGTNFIMSKEEKENRLDSVRIRNFVDNGTRADNPIGIAYAGNYQ